MLISPLVSENISPAKQDLITNLLLTFTNVGEDTDCPAFHFKNMRLIINTAFCGSVAGNRYFMDCPEKQKKFPTCNEYVASNPDELNDAYWEIRGIYVYEREWIVPESV